MAKLDRPGFDEWYAVVRRWVDAALLSGDSVITPGARVWTLENLKDLHHRYVDNFDEGDDNFWAKLEKQLGSARPETTQLMAEVLYLYHLPMVGKLKLSTKVHAVQRVLDLMEPPVSLGDDLQHVFNVGIARESQNYVQQLYYQLKMLIEAANGVAPAGLGRGSSLAFAFAGRFAESLPVRRACRFGHNGRRRRSVRFARTICGLRTAAQLF